MRCTRLRGSILGLVSVALLAAACGSSSKGKSTSGATPTTVGGAKGGTLKLVGQGDVDFMDTANGYYTATYTLERAFARQLYTYPNAPTLRQQIDPVPDLATAMPTVTAGATVYTIHIRQGALWNTTPPRQVTAADEVLGMKRLCNPANPVGAPSYFESTITGMKAYCDGFGKVKGDVASIKAYINSNNISGVQAIDSTTVQFTLTQPASDFLNILALPFASAQPTEVTAVEPFVASGTPSTIYSDGPYAITKYDPTALEIDLGQNASWTQSSDPLRHQYVQNIVVKENLNGSAAESQVQQELEAGSADLQWNTTVPTANLAALQSPWDKRLGIFPSPDTNPYLVFNLQSPNNGGALQNVKVRKALEYAVDKVALGKIYGGSALNTPLNQVLPPGAEGYVQFNDYQSAGNMGDANKCKSLLAASGATLPITLTDYYRDNGKHPLVEQEIANDFGKCGVTVKGVSIHTGYYGSKGIGSDSTAKAGAWDISEPGWVPDWYGPTNARAMIPPLFDGRGTFPFGADWGAYKSTATDDLIDRALKATSLSEAQSLWHQADQQIMADAAFIPFQTQSTALFRASRVHNAIFSPLSEAYDITQIWLSA